MKAPYLLIIFSFILGIKCAYSQDTEQYQDFEYFLNAARKQNNKSHYALGLQSLEKAVVLAKENGDTKKLIDAYHHLALNYHLLKNNTSTTFYWDRAGVLLDELSYPYGEAQHKYIEALLYFDEQKNFLPISTLNKAKQLNNDRNLLLHIQLTEAEINLVIEKFDEAEKSFNALLVNNDIYEPQYLATRAYLGLAKLNELKNNTEEATKFAKLALASARKHEFLRELLNSKSSLARIYEKNGKFALALENQKSIVAIKDSVFNIEKLKLEAKTADKIQFSFMSDTIKDNEEKIAVLSESKNRSEITAILTSAFLTIISLLAVSLYRNNQIKLKTNDLLQTKNRELQAARDAAIQAMETKTNFLSTVSHELRTPLYAVTGLTNLLLEENPSKNQKEHLKALKFSGDYLLNFINDILQINKIDAVKIEPLSVAFNLKQQLSEVIESLQQSAKANHTKIIMSYDDTIPQRLLSDPLKLSQIFINLIGNALKFTSHGVVEVIVKQKHTELDTIVLNVAVKDNGIGISKDRLENIFNSFEQGSVQINRTYGGTGLGLTIVRSLLGLFGSEIKVESELGMGSTFFFDIAMKFIETTDNDTTFIPEIKNYNLDGLHILIVEDNKINQVITKKMLTKKSITSEIANNGAEAISMAMKNKYDAILMDIHMPEIGGEEATIEIRKFNTKTPIIALTAISLDDSLESFYAAGCNDVVTKPFKPEVFYQKIGENIFNPKPRH